MGKRWLQPFWRSRTAPISNQCWSLRIDGRGRVRPPSPPARTPPLAAALRKCRSMTSTSTWDTASHALPWLLWVRLIVCFPFRSWHVDRLRCILLGSKILGIKQSQFTLSKIRQIWTRYSAERFTEESRAESRAGVVRVRDVVTGLSCKVYKRIYTFFQGTQIFENDLVICDCVVFKR